MKRKKLPARDMLLKYLDYNAETGALIWRPRTIEDFADCVQPGSRFKTFNTRYAGKEAMTCVAGDASENGRHGSFFGTNYHTARIVWKMVHDEEPDEVVCINGDHSDIRLKNLKPSAKPYSGKNTTMFSNNTSGVRGVSWCTQKNLWVARITVNGKVKHLGYFATKDRAAKSRRAAERKFGFRKDIPA